MQEDNEYQSRLETAQYLLDVKKDEQKFIPSRRAVPLTDEKPKQSLLKRQPKETKIEEICSRENSRANLKEEKEPEPEKVKEPESKKDPEKVCADENNGTNTEAKDDAKTAFLNTLEQGIIDAEKDTRIKYDLDNIEDEEYVESKLFFSRSKIVKAHFKYLEEIRAFLYEKYPQELRVSKEKYPTAWMLSDKPKRQKSIMENIDKYQSFFPLLNYLFEYNRYWRGDELKEMGKRNDKIIGKKHTYKDSKGKKVKREFATFITDKPFYEVITKDLRISKIYVKKFLQALVDCKILKKHGQVGKIGWLYSDGYYVPAKDNLRKVAYLKDNPTFRKSLRNFRPPIY